MLISRCKDRSYEKMKKKIYVNLSVIEISTCCLKKSKNLVEVSLHDVSIFLCTRNKMLDLNYCLIQ